jgi:hypothetical protein
VAYVSDETGIEEVYVKPMAHAGKYRVSVNGGVQPRWRRDSRELFFLGPRNESMTVAVGAAASFVGSSPVRLYEGCGGVKRTTFEYLYDVAPDGRHLWICAGDDGASAVATVNWASALSMR